MHRHHLPIRLQSPLRFNLEHQQLQRWLLLIVLAMAVSIILLLIIYHQRYTQLYAVKSWLRHVTGTYEYEQSGQLEYAYTDGDARFKFPEVGIGSFRIALQLGGPAGSVPVAAHLGSATQAIDFGVVEQVRMYHVLLPTTIQGDLGMRLTSEIYLIGSDPRPLGLLVGPIAVHGLDAALPSPNQLAATFLTLCLFALGIAQFSTTLRWKAGLLLLLAVLLSAPHGFTRGLIMLRPWWIGFGAAAIVSMVLWRAETWPPMTAWGGVVLVCIVWRITLWVAALVALGLSDVVRRQWDSFSFKAGTVDGDLASLPWRAITTAWMNWDAGHYQTIAQTGYTFTGVPWPNIAFFPLYPLLVRAVLLTGASSSVAALLVSHIALLMAALLLYDLLVRDFGRIVAYRAIIFLLVFPTAFFFVAGYTESLALLLTVGAVWAMRRQRWWLTGIAGGLLAMTRVPGVLIAPVLGLAYLQHHRWRWRAVRVDLVAILLPPLGLALFMLYQWHVFGTPWAFLIAQENWNNGMAPPWVIPQRILTAFTKPSWWGLAILQLSIWIGVLGLTVLALRRLPLEYALTGLLLLVPAYCANIRDSLPRHVLISFPIFVALAHATQRFWLRWLIVTLLLPLLVLLTMLFVNGFWIG